MNSARARQQANGLFHTRFYAALVDFAHGEHADPGLANRLALAWVERPRTEEDNSRRGEGSVGPAEPGAQSTQAKQGRHRHAMDIAAGRRLGCVDVAVGIDPQNPYLAPGI